MKALAKFLILALSLIAGLAIGLGYGVYTYPNKVFAETEAQRELVGSNEAGWTHLRELVDADFKAVVRPNQDTIYSSKFIDLKEGPVKLTVPAFDKYYSLAIYNENTDIAGYLSSRTHGTGKEQSILIAPPGFKSDLGEKEIIIAGSDKVWILARFYITKDEDYPVVHKIQDSLKLERQ